MSWNDFFTRRFHEGEPPVAAPRDDRVIVSPCESTPYGISADVRRQDQLWVKNQSYSLLDMLAGDPSVDDLVGGTVYQAAGRPGLPPRQRRGVGLLPVRRVDLLPRPRPRVVDQLALSAVPQPHDPDAPLVKVCTQILRAS
ncbi:phosphatidylserine decarboxylase [uncultured Friedmanniella sp.]|uniref:phosphatidylserine decarboxylase n=1 Tax=uncultured Friedmanniella sp. TaxID=335381 RepID=UPI0035CA004E